MSENTGTKKRLLFLHTDMELGGAETSLLGLLHSLDYDRVSVDLMLYRHRGELLPLLPPEVNLLPEVPAYAAMSLPIKAAVRAGQMGVAAARVRAKLTVRRRNKTRHYSDYGYVMKQFAHMNAVRRLPPIPGHYDMAVSFNDPHIILARKTDAALRLGWFHTDFRRITPDEDMETYAWAGCDYVVNVSTGCKEGFDAAHPALADKSLVMENILSRSVVEYRSGLIPQSEVEQEMPRDGALRILSIGRFCEAKNFDHVPAILSRIRASGLDVRWYLIGFGSDEPLIRQRIAEAGMEDSVIILGKKDNPYPYIVSCDLYCQPSRYEGKSVTVREAQLLGKPTVIARYATSAAQLTDGVDGLIVPQDDEGCADAVAALLRDPARMQALADGCRAGDYTNASEVETLYRLLGL